MTPAAPAVPPAFPASGAGSPEAHAADSAAAGTDAPLVPAWGQVLADAPAQGRVEEPVDEIPEPEADAVFGLSWPQIVILVAVGLLLGVLVWLLLESRSQETTADASSAVAAVTVDARAPGVL